MAYYLITGGAGFLGSNIVLRLAQSGAKIRVLDNFSAGLSRSQFENLIRSYQGSVEVLEGDIRDIETCTKAMVGVTHVLHHAAISSALRSIEDPVETMSVNVVGTANLLSAARDSGTVEKFINASSCAVYGDGSSSAKTESAMLFPNSPFATSMQATENLCSNFFKSYKLCTTSIRYFNVYGPCELTVGPVRSAVARFIQDSSNQGDIGVNGGGGQTRDFIHIDDAVSSVIKMCEADSQRVAGQIYNIGSGEKVSVMELLEIISHLSGWPVYCVLRQALPHEMKHSKADIVKASSVLGFKAEIDLESGVKDMIAAAADLKQAA